MDSEILSQFLFENSEIIFDKLQKISCGTELVEPKFAVKMFVHFGLLESISNEPKTIGDD